MPNVTTLQDVIDRFEYRLDLLTDAVMLNKPVLDIDEAAVYTRYKKSQLYKLTSSNEIPFSKPNGKKIYFLRDDLTEWMKRNRIKSNFEIEQEANNHV